MEKILFPVGQDLWPEIQHPVGSADEFLNGAVEESWLGPISRGRITGRVPLRAETIVTTSITPGVGKHR